MNHIVLWNIDPRIIIPDKLNIPVRKIFTNNCSPIMAGGVVPGPIYHSHAGLLSQPSRGGEPVRLAWGPLVNTDHTDTVRVETNRTVGRQHLHQSGGPEPTVDIQGLIVSCLTAVNLHRVRGNENALFLAHDTITFYDRIGSQRGMGEGDGLIRQIIQIFFYGPLDNRKT